ncbi:MAG: hypothetical protein HC902_04235 [Calothrix sp. SM1_5_4]|nr:hypothetical protein [Calothrix sp. SM1_5_4]
MGKPNAGKSSIANRLLGENRMLVSELAGTTVDAVEAEFEFNGNKYILADTAGLRRAGKQKDGVEVLSTFKTRDAVHKSDLILLVMTRSKGLRIRTRALSKCASRSTRPSSSWRIKRTPRARSARIIATGSASVWPVSFISSPTFRLSSPARKAERDSRNSSARSRISV